MNLNNLANSLPTSNLANAEADLLNTFKAAAMSITTLYKSSRRTSKRAYNAGYAAACQDLLLMIQQRVSAGETGDAEGGGMTIGRIMDYIEARLEAIRSTEEEEEEENEKDRERERRQSAGATSRPTGSSNMKALTPSTSALRSRDSVVSPPLTPLSPPNVQSTTTFMRSGSPSPSPAAPLRNATSSLQRQSKARLLQLSNASPKEAIINPTASSFTFPATTVLSTASDAPLATIPFPSVPAVSAVTAEPVPEVAGTKRRHAAMMDASSSGAAPASVSTSRRRTRNLRNGAGSLRESGSTQDQNQYQTQGGDAMDVEEDGRERKRVARR
ncbi:hypothetical protein NM688_g6779 [Phlebia brevispora]|uniref:Uncharacterized protein n=1 Tax=Phlebia brevispora TaxID=194682 RepID=A0ACC1SCS3_9APHY|nr:hypothetical protein NM688_g6779 [Phlebia brevispora]